jgi:Glycosyltransferase family 28 C-terminal domain
MENAEQKSANDAPKVLVAPLNWGLGHATRCIPIIRELLAQGATVTLASDGVALALLRKEFPELTTLELPSYNILYSNSRNVMWSIFFQSYKILLAALRERAFIKRYLAKNPQDVLISDNRLGCHDVHAHSVIISHQLHIKAISRFIRWSANAIHHFSIRKFDEVWIPDYPNEPNLAGDLAHGDLGNLPSVTYLGAISRMRPMPEVRKRYPIAAILSGPEPQRTYFEHKTLSQLAILALEQPDETFLLVRGMPKDAPELPPNLPKNIEIHDYMTSETLNEHIAAAHVVLCRTGYSTVMDLAAMDVHHAIFVPTPGQSEQEYLADTYRSTRTFCTQTQANLDLKKALASLHEFSGFAQLPDMRAELPRVIAKVLSARTV